MGEEVKTERYNRTGYIRYGHRVEMNHYAGDGIPDIAPLVALGTEKIKEQLLESIDAEDKAFEIIGAAINQWKKQATVTRACNYALEYLKTSEVKHTANQWIRDEDDGRAHISNRVYQMSYRLWEDTEFDSATKTRIPVAWYVTWDVCLSTPNQNYSIQIAGQRNKRYTDKAAAQKYVEGRKQAYSHLFEEMSPPIPMKYQEHFMVHGLLLPGYTVEEKVKVQLNTEKTSVIEKLNEAKVQDKSATPLAPGKKKEDMEI